MSVRAVVAPTGGGTPVGVITPPGGTTNTIPRWTGASTLGNSAISQADGAIASVTNLAVAATNGTYSQAALTGGTGTGATADIIVASGAVTSITVRNPGSGYTVGDSLSCATIGAVVAVATVASIASSANGSGNITSVRIGAGNQNPVSTLDATGLTTIRKFGAYASVNPLGTPTTSAIVSALSIDTSAESTGKYIASATDTAIRALSVSTGIDASANSLNAEITGARFNPILLSSGGGTKTIRGVLSVAQASSSSLTGRTIGIYGSESQATVFSDVGAGNTFSIVTGIRSLVSINSTNAQTVTSASNFLGTLQILNAAHTVTNLYGLQLSSPSVSGGATITNRWGISQEDASASNVFAGVSAMGLAAATKAGAVVDVAGSTTARAALRLRSGTAPTAPNDGDIWFDGTDVKIRVAGVTKTFTLV